MLVGRIGELDQGTARNGRPATGEPYGQFRYWEVDAFAQDSWKLRSNLTFEYGVRGGFGTNNRELSGEGGYFTPSLYASRKGVSGIEVGPDPGLTSFANATVGG